MSKNMTDAVLPNGNYIEMTVTSNKKPLVEFYISTVDNEETITLSKKEAIAFLEESLKMLKGSK